MAHTPAADALDDLIARRGEAYVRHWQLREAARRILLATEAAAMAAELQAGIDIEPDRQLAASSLNETLARFLALMTPTA